MSKAYNKVKDAIEFMSTNDVILEKMEVILALKGEKKKNVAKATRKILKKISAACMEEKYEREFGTRYSPNPDYRKKKKVRDASDLFEKYDVEKRVRDSSRDQREYWNTSKEMKKAEQESGQDSMFDIVDYSDIIVNKRGRK